MKRQDALGRFREQAGQIIEARDGMFWELLFRRRTELAGRLRDGLERLAGQGAGSRERCRGIYGSFLRTDILDGKYRILLQMVGEGYILDPLPAETWADLQDFFQGLEKAGKDLAKEKLRYAGKVNDWDVRYLIADRVMEHAREIAFLLRFQLWKEENQKEIRMLIPGDVPRILRLGEYRVKIVDIPTPYTMPDGTKVLVKDLNELLYYQGKDAVREAITSASAAEIPSIIDYTDVSRFDMSDVPGFTTGLYELDMALDKFYLGTTTILTGIPGSGKSSFLSTLICKSMEQGFPCFIYSGELSNPSLKNWVDFVHAGQRGINAYRSQANGGVYYRVKPDVFKKINETYKGMLFFYRDGFDHKVTHLLQTAENVVRRNGVKTLIFDNMTSVDLENNDKDKYIRQEEFIRNVVEFSKRWQVCCIVVLHPRKMQAVQRMGLFDLQGVTAAINLAHRVLSLYRVTKKEKEGEMGRNGTWYREPVPYDVIIDILKDRFGSAAGKEVGLYYDVPSKRFFDTVETLDHRYAWDDADYTGIPLPFGAPQLDALAEVYGEVEA